MSVTFKPKHTRNVVVKDEENGDYEVPEVFCNFANLNAREVLTLVGIVGGPLYGDIEGEMLDRVIAKTLRVLNDSKEHGFEGFEENDPGRARVINFGSTDEQTRHRLQRFLEVCTVAKRTGDTVVYD